MPDLALRPLRMLPASFGDNIGSLILDGGAKSKAVNVPDFLRSCGDGRTAKFSKDDANGVNARTLGL